MTKNKVMVIPARKSTAATKTLEARPQLKVAAYCRVSTDSDEQATSYEAQIEHYTELINNHPEWSLAGIFADDGISGTNTKNRTEFNKMITACEKGEINLVITKSISRFARNTLDCLKYIRKLKELNIPVFFEKENINTMDAKGEVMITIMASLAQQESQSLSQNVKLGLQYRYQQGHVQVNHNWFLGYTKDSDGNLIIDPEQAEVVKRIYREYLLGYSMDKIAAGLEKDGILTGAGRKKWWPSTVKKILTNEKYIGDALLQKTYTTDFLNKTRVKNNGIVPQYYVKDSHPAIIPKKLFMEVQSEFVRRSTKKAIGPNGKKRSFSSNNAFSNIIICGNCNEIFCRVHWYRNNQSFIKWRCGSKLNKNGVDCDSKSIDEKDLKEMVIRAINAILAAKNDYLDVLKNNIQKIIDHSSTPDIVSMEDKLMSLQEELLQKVNDRKQYDDIAKEILRLREIKDKAETEMFQRTTNINRIKEVCDFIETQPQELTKYDDPLMRRLLDSIIVYNDHITVKLKSGIILNVSKK